MYKKRLCRGKSARNRWYISHCKQRSRSLRVAKKVPSSDFPQQLAIFRYRQFCIASCWKTASCNTALSVHTSKSCGGLVNLCLSEITFIFLFFYQKSTYVLVDILKKNFWFQQNSNFLRILYVLLLYLLHLVILNSDGGMTNESGNCGCLR